MKTLFNRFIKDESGATAIEYGLIAALLAVAIIAAVTAVGSQLSATFNKVSNSLTTANAN
jgi:pilus assembly protein Flp/PilA